MSWLRVTLFFFSSAALASAKLHVVVSHTVLVDLVLQVAGEHADVDCLLPPNVDPHSYEPKPADIRRLAHADLVVMNGLGLEPWAQKLVDDSGYRGPIVRASEGAPRLLKYSAEENPESHSGADLAYDPHTWQNPKNVAHSVAVIRDALIACDPSDAAAFRTQSKRFTEELRELDAYARAQFATIPPVRRTLVTSHDSLRYLADEYGFRVVPIAGAQPDREPSARELAGIVSLIRREHVPAVFVEATASAKLSQLIADEAHVAVVVQLYTDSLGPPGSPGATYLGMFRSNVATIVHALR